MKWKQFDWGWGYFDEKGTQVACIVEGGGLNVEVAKRDVEKRFAGKK